MSYSVEQVACVHCGHTQDDMAKTNGDLESLEYLLCTCEKCGHRYAKPILKDGERQGWLR